MIIAVDFDGTVVDHRFPDVGPDVPGAVDALRVLQARGHAIILWTMRSGKHLDDAVAWYKERNIELFGVNTNPQQSSWTSSPKAYAHRYVDDAAAGCPMVKLDGFHKPCVDWHRILALPEFANF